MWIIKHHLPFSNVFEVIGYETSKEKAIKYLKSIGYGRHNIKYDYYEDSYHSDCYKIEKIIQLPIGE